MGYRIYIVRPGDTLFSIAQMFNTTVQVLLQLNDIPDPDLIYPGQRLLVPRSALPVLRRGDRKIYVVYLQRLLLAAGYDIGVIDGIFGPRVEKGVKGFQQREGLPVTGVINAGTWRALAAQAPEIPQPPAFPIRYTVQEGDTLFKIARRYNISLDLLLQANPQIVDPDVIMPGQVIIIPLQ